MQTDDILSFKNWWPSSYKKTVNSDKTSGRGIHKDDRITFKISSYKHFIFSHRLPGKVEVKSFINGICHLHFPWEKPMDLLNFHLPKPTLLEKFQKTKKNWWLEKAHRIHYRLFRLLQCYFELTDNVWERKNGRLRIWRTIMLKNANLLKVFFFFVTFKHLFDKNKF